MKYSRQRELIKETVLNLNTHPTADEIYSLLKPANPGISLGTVYRNLKLLSDSGDIIKISVPGAGDRFDRRTGEHHHLLCDCCGRICDLEVELRALIERKIHTDTGFSVSGLELIAHGSCPDCLRTSAV